MTALLVAGVPSRGDSRVLLTCESVGLDKHAELLMPFCNTRYYSSKAERIRLDVAPTALWNRQNGPQP